MTINDIILDTPEWADSSDSHTSHPGPGISSSLGEVENHVLNQWTSENIIVLKGWALIQQLVVLPGGSTAIKGLPISLQCGLVLGIIVLALRILHCTGQVIVVEVVLLHESLPILVCIQPGTVPKSLS